MALDDVKSTEFSSFHVHWRVSFVGTNMTNCVTAVSEPSFALCCPMKAVTAVTLDGTESMDSGRRLH